MIKGRYWSPYVWKQPLVMMYHGLRTLQSGKRKLPDFIIIGVQKGGTTSLYRYLIQHPDVLAATRKETHYYDELHAKGLKWYKGFFPKINAAEKPFLTCEATPDYFFY